MGVAGTVNSLAVAGDDLYVGGNFPNASYMLGTGRIARWDGANWHALSFLYHRVRALDGVGSDLYVGGDFYDISGNGSMSHIARWGTGYRVYLPVVVR